MRILLIDDNETNSLFVEALLTKGRRGPVVFEVRRETRLFEGLLKLDETEAPYDAILLDLGHPECGGLTTLTLVKAHAPNVPVVVVSALDHPETVEAARQAGARDYLIKGRFDAGRLERALIEATGCPSPTSASPEIRGTFLRTAGEV